MSEYEFAVISFICGDDYEIAINHISSYDNWADAEDARTVYLKDFPKLNPQNVQVIQLVL